MRLVRHSELHFPGLFDDLRGLENFETDYATVVAEIGNDTGRISSLSFTRAPRSVMVSVSVSLSYSAFMRQFHIS